MNEKLKEIINSGAMDGAKEIYENYENYTKACEVARQDYETKLEQLKEENAEAIKLYNVVEAVKNAIAEKLTPKE